MNCEAIIAGALVCYGKPLFIDKEEAIKRYNELDKKDRVAKSDAKPDLKSTSRRELKQLYAEKLSKYAERSQWKFSEKIEEAISSAEKIVVDNNNVEQKKNAIVFALRKLGLTVIEKASKTSTSKYLDM